MSFMTRSMRGDLEVLLEYSRDEVVRGPNQLESDSTRCDLSLIHEEDSQTPDRQDRSNILRVRHGVERKSLDPWAWLTQATTVVNTIST